MALLAWLYLAAGNLWTLPDHLTRIFVFFDMNWHVCAAVIFGMAAIITLYGYRGENAIAEVGIVALGFMYVLLPFMLLFLMSIQPMDYLLATRNPIADLAGGRAERYTYMVPLGIFFLTWALDVFAYFGGKFLGKKKLWERISPKKTWEGAIIGAFFTLGLAVALEFLWPQTWSWLVVGAIISVFSQFGDLVESMYKRGLNLKDSGGILPGHGGVLDRFDGMLITLPMIYLYISAAVF